MSRHRHNLNTLVRVQQRYNAEQFNEVMRLESELGQITANLLHLIDSECLIFLTDFSSVYSTIWLFSLEVLKLWSRIWLLSEKLLNLLYVIV